MALASIARLRKLRFESLEARQLLAAPEPLTTGRIVWHSYTDYGALDGRIHVYDFDDSAYYARATTTIADEVTHAHNPNLSADGRYMTFMGLPKGPAYGANWRQYLDVFIYDFVTDNVTNLSTQLGLDDLGELEEDPVLSPAGDKVAFKRNVANIWEADVHEHTLRQLTSGAGERSGPQYSPDGSQLIFWVGSGTSSLLGRISLQGTLPASPATLHNNTGVQDYFPSYWDANRVLYTSWRNSTERDDDVKIWNIFTQVDTFAAFNSTQAEDSDPFGMTATLVGFSTTRGSSKWQLWYGDPVTGDVASLGISQVGKHNLGAEYTLHKVVYQAPSADFDADGDVDGRDFLDWQRGYGIAAPNATQGDGDADHDLSVDALDLAFWQSQYAAEIHETVRANGISDLPLIAKQEGMWFELPNTERTGAEILDHDLALTQISQLAICEAPAPSPSHANASDRLSAASAEQDLREDFAEPSPETSTLSLELGDELSSW